MRLQSSDIDTRLLEYIHRRILDDITGDLYALVLNRTYLRIKPFTGNQDNGIINAVRSEAEDATYR